MYGQKYGAKAPLMWSDAHEQPLRERQALWNDLVEVYWAARSRERALLCETDPELAPLYTEVDDLDRQLAELPRSTDAEREIWQAVLERAHAARDALWPRIAQMKRSHPGLSGRLSAEVWEPAQKETYTIACGKGRRYPDLHWGDCNDVHDSFWRAVRSRKNPRARHRSSRAAFARQMMAKRVGGEREVRPDRKRAVVTGGTLVGATWESLCSPKGHGGVRVLPYNLDRARKEWKLLQVTLAPDTLLLLPFRVHVPIPPQALIKRVRVTRDILGSTTTWHVAFSVDAPPRGTGRAEGDRTLYAGLGWRMTPQGLRILAGVTDAGEEWHVTLPLYWLEQMRYANELTAMLRIARNSMVERVRKWRLSHPDVPADLNERLIAASNPQHTRALLTLAMDPQTPADLREDLSTWAWGTARGARATHHALLAVRSDSGMAAEILGEIRGRERVTNLRRKLVSRRQVLYREISHLIVRKCKRIVLGKFDGSDAARADLPHPVRTLRQFAAPFEFQTALAWAARKVECDVDSLDHVGASRFCARHPEVDLYAGRDHGRLWLTCDRCGEALDRDANYALNLMGRDAPDVFERLIWQEPASERSQRRILNWTEQLMEDTHDVRRSESRIRHKTR